MSESNQYDRVRHGCPDCVAYRSNLNREPCLSCTRWSNWSDKRLAVPAPTEEQVPERVHEQVAIAAMPTEVKRGATPLTENQRKFLWYLRQSKCCRVVGGENTYRVAELVSELDGVMNSMAIGAMVTTLVKRGVITNTKEFGQVLRFTEFGETL